MRFHFLMSSLLRPQLTQRSPLSWQVEIQGFSISLAIVSPLRSRLIELDDFSSCTMCALALLFRVEADIAV